MKNAILQLAIQGKLVPQNNSDEPASELLKRIHSEKDRLLQEGKIKREKPLPPISEEEIPFEIPSTWAWVKFGYIGCFSSGYTPKPHQLAKSGDIPYFKISDMNTCGNETYLQNAVQFLCDENPRYYLVGSIVYPKNGGAVYTNKRRILVKNSVVDLNTGVYTPYDQNTIPYLYLIFSFLDFKKYSIASPLPTLDINAIKNILVPLPPLEEQKRIVAKIEELMPLVEEYGNAEKELSALNAEFSEQLRKSILQLAVQGKLVPQNKADEPAGELVKRIRNERTLLQKKKLAKKSQAHEKLADDEIPFEIPKNWEWVNLGWLCMKVGAGSTPKGGSSVYKKQGIKFLREQNIYDDGLHLQDVVFIDNATHSLKSGSQVQAQDILMNITGGSIGRNALVPDDFDTANINQHVLIIRLVDRTLRFYLHYCFSAPVVLNQMFSKQAGDKPGLSAYKVENFLIPIPPLEEQMRIVARLEELLSICKDLK